MLARSHQTHRYDESASAMIAAIAMLVLAAFVAVAIIVSAMSSRDDSRRQLEATATEQLARDAGTVLAASYSSLEAGEQNAFIPPRSVVAKHAAALGSGATVTNNDAMHRDVLTSPSYTVVQKIDDSRLGYWQPYLIRQPSWGVTPSGTVEAYIRAWTSAAGGANPTRAQIYRLVLRPTWFADYQVIADGKIAFGGGARLDGRVHSNGADSSLNNAYGNMNWQILLASGSPSIQCTPSTRITTTSGNVNNNSPCSNSKPTINENVGQHINILRAREAVENVRALCGTSSFVKIICSTTTDDIKVTINGNNVNVQGAGSGNATVTGSTPGSPQGVVVVASGHVHVRGRLGAKGRLTIMTAARPGQQFFGSDGSAPSIWFDDGGGSYGANANDPTSSFGAVAEGNIVADEWTACGATLRGAFIGISGGMMSNPRWKTPFLTTGGYLCPSPLTIEGSIVGHYGPAFVDQSGGFAQRRYTMLDSLYNNPPPLYPTISDWQVIKFAPANADCISNATPDLSCD